MALKPENTTYFTMMKGGYKFTPKESVFLNAYEKLSNKQLGKRFGAGESTIEDFIRKLKAKGSLPEGSKIRPDDLNAYKEGLRKLKQWAKNPTFKNWAKYFGAEATGSAPDIGKNIRKYFTGESLNAAPKKILDFLKADTVLGSNVKGVLKTFTTDFFKKNRPMLGGTQTGAANDLRTSFEKVIKINNEFKKNPKIDLNTLTKNLYKEAFTKGDDATKLRLATTTSDDVAKYLEALNKFRDVPPGMSSQWSPPSGEKLKSIVTYIGSQTDGFRFREGTLRKYKFSIRDSLLNLAPNTTRNLRSKLAIPGGVVDEVVGLSATTFQNAAGKNAAGYTELMQIIPDDINKKKAKIDRAFKIALEASMRGEFEGVEKFNKLSETFAKKYKVDTPLIRPGGNPTETLLYFDKLSNEAKKNVLKLADNGKGFSISSTTLPVKELGKKLSAVKQDPELYVKLLNAVQKAPQVCRKILNYQTGGISTTCAAAIETDPNGAANKLKNLDVKSGPLKNVKDAANNFLQAFKTPGSFKGKVALGAGAVIGGFGAGALVKQFRNDDPSTYLNNEGQMEGMLISDVEEAASKVEDNPILNNQFKLEALAAAGITAPIAKGVYNKQRFGTPQLLETPMELDQEMKTLKRTVRQITHPGGKKAKRIGAAAQETIRMARQRMAELNKYIVETTDPLISSGKGPIRSALGLSGVLGKGLWALTSPIVALPSTAMYIAKDKMEGKSTTDALTNPLTYLAPAFMNQSVKALAKAGASRGLLAIASAGLAGTAAAPLLPAIAIGSGIAAAGSLGYQAYKKFFDKQSDGDFFK